MPTNPPYVLLANGGAALRFLEEAEKRRSPPLLIVVNAPGRQRDAEQIRRVGERIGIPVHEWSPAVRDAISDAVAGANAWILSIYFGHVLDDRLIAAAQGRAVNLHASLLPWCRGAHTNVYPLIERSPAGVTLHVMTARVDAGGILMQREIPVRPWDTGGTLYRRLEDEGLRLLLDHWPEGVMKAWPGKPQSGGGSEHKSAEFQKLETYSLDAHPEARAFYDLLRARTFPPHTGLRVIVDGRVVEATVTLKEVDGG